MPATLTPRTTQSQPCLCNHPVRKSRPRRILIADDCEEFADCLAWVLRLHGYEVRVVYDGASAVREAAGFRPDVVLSDIGLPGIDGCEVARQLRHQTRAGELFLVALTGYENEFVRFRAQEAGFDDFLVKPVEIAEIENLLSTGPGGEA